MKIEELVADLELCKKIPAGEFEDCAFCWQLIESAGFVCRESGCEQVRETKWTVSPCHPRKIAIRRKMGEEIYPAPTLEEVLQKFPNHCRFRILEWTSQTASASNLLQLWFDVIQEE